MLMTHLRINSECFKHRDLWNQVGVWISIWATLLAGTNLQRVAAQIWVQTAKLTGGDSDASDSFGGSLDISGNRIVVGSFGHDHGAPFTGGAYVFEESDSGWTQVQELLGSDVVAYDSFSVPAISGAIAIVGANLRDDNGRNSGAAYVFDGSGTTWSEVVKLTASDGEISDGFGSKVSVSNNRAIISAGGNSAGGSSSGAVYVFEQSDSIWTEAAKFFPTDLAPEDDFGDDVAMFGDWLVVSSTGDDDNGLSSGSAYVFQSSDSGWEEIAKLLPDDPAPWDSFGAGVAISDGYVLIGADGADAAGEDSGAAYIFEWSGSAWNQAAKLTGSDTAAGDQFGSDVALAGDYAVVGASGHDGAGANAGAVYIFERSGSTWNEISKLVPGELEAGDRFGSSTAMVANRIVVGATGDDDRGSSSGAAYVFSLRFSSDFNGDGDVDDDDLLIWQNNFGAESRRNEPLPIAMGNADGDFDVDGIDFLIWQREFGLALPLSTQLISIPEPATGLFATLILVGMIVRQGRSCPAQKKHPAKCLRVFLSVGFATVVAVMGLAPHREAHAFGLWASGLGLDRAARWDAAPRIYADPSPGAILPPVERSLDGGLRYSLVGGSYEGFRDLLSWQNPVPSSETVQEAVELAFAAWTATDPETGLHSTLSFLPDFGTDPASEFNVGAEIDVMLSNFGHSNPTGNAFAYISWGPVQDVLLTSGATVQAAPILGADIWMNNNPNLRWTTARIQEVLTHEIGHALGLQDVDAYSGPFGEFVDDNYDATNSSTARATLTNSFAALIDPYDPGNSPVSYYTVADGDPGFDTSGVSILMESNSGPGSHNLAAPLQNDDFAGRQFLYPFVAVSNPEPDAWLLLAIGLCNLGLATGRSRRW